jgi:hypothetical protein
MSDTQILSLKKRRNYFILEYASFIEAKNFGIVST